MQSNNFRVIKLVNIHKIIPKDKARVINLGFDLTKFQTNLEKKRLDFVNEYNIDEDEICIGIIGRLTDIKNHDMFFEVMESVNCVIDKYKEQNEL